MMMAKKPSGGFGEEITFYLDSAPIGPFHELKALDGMTWKDWIDCEYNTVGIYGESSIVLYPPMGFPITEAGGEWVKVDDIIVAETVYAVG